MMTRRDFARWATACMAAVTVSRSEADAEGYAQRFWDRARGDLRRFRAEQLPVVEAAADRLAEIVAGGGRLRVFDHRGPYVAEVLGRAGGLMAISQVTADSVAPHDGVILVTDTPDDSRDMAMALAARAAGAYCVAIAPVRHGPKGAAGACDHAIGNYVSDADAAVRLPGVDAPIAPTSGIMNVAILWTLIAAYVEAMERRGKVPSVWLSIKCPGAKERNEQSLARAEKGGF